MNNNTKIIGESFFINIPKDIILLETDFVRMDKSIIWECNKLFWKHYMLWEKTYGENFEASLPSGISESHKPEFIRASTTRFLEKVKRLKKQNRLPEKIYVYEQGPGSGIFAKGFLDYMQQENPEIYKKITYILSDTSQEILKTCTHLLSLHNQHTKYFMQDAFEERVDTFSGKILFARHSNMWDTWPCRLIHMRKSGLGEKYVRAVCGRKFEKFVKEIQTRGLEYTLIHHPTLWKDFFRSIKLQTQTVHFNKIDVEQNPYLQYVQKAEIFHTGENTLISNLLIENLTLLNKIIDWKRQGYIEIVDYIILSPREKLFPKKFDGAIAYAIDGRIIETWCQSQQKSYAFTPIRKLNTLLTITMPNTSTQQTLQELIHTASFELYPEDSLLKKVQKLKRNSRIAVTCTSKKGLEYTIDTAIQLKKEGYDAYPHIVARLIPDETYIQHIKSKLTTSNVFDMFVAAGDIPQPTGKYSVAMDVLQAFKKAHFPFGKICVTGYPEGHPYIAKEKLLEALLQKQAFAQKAKIEMHIITQLCFDANTTLTWIDAMRKQGIILPVIIGLAGPCDGLRLAQFAIKCGVGMSAKLIGSHKALGKNLATHIGFGYTPDKLMNDLITHPLFKKSNIVGFHFYTFNNIDGIVKWLR